MNYIDKSTTNSGIGFCGLLTILFIALKLTNKIDWSWWWVLSPIWLPIVAVIVLLILIVIFTIIVLLILIVIFTISDK